MQDRRVDPEKLRALISRRGLSNKVFGELLGLSPSMVQYVLAGTRQFGDVNAQRAAQVLSCAVEDFTQPWGTAA